MHRSASQSSSKSLLADPGTGRTAKFRKITLDTILSSTSLTRSSKETHEAYLQRVTHLHLQGKRIRVIDGLELCTHLKVLYLYDNQIETIQNLDFSDCLEYLYLQNNQIKQIPMLNMKNLRKLHLDDNEISVLSGLTECSQLVELSLARQRLPSFGSLQVEPQSIMSISYTLEAIDISGNGITKLSPFVALYNLRRFFAQDNNIIDIPEIEVIVALPNLAEATFSGNPCCKLFKYRDMVIAASSDSLTTLDEIPVPRHQQVAIKGLMDHRRKIGAMTRFQTSMDGSSYQPQDLGSGSLEAGPEDSFVIRGHGGHR